MSHEEFFDRHVAQHVAIFLYNNGMKIVSTGETLASPAFHQKKLKAKRKRRILYTLLVLIILGFVLYLLRNDKLRISNISVLGANVVSADLVTQDTQEILNGYYLWVIPRNSILLYPKSEIRRKLNAEFPRFASINVSLENTHTLDVEVVERNPFALYCTSLSTTSPCYFLDETGYVFDFAPIFSDGVYFIYSSTQPLENPLGSNFLPLETFKSLTHFISRLKSLSVNSRQLNFDGENYELVLPTGGKLTWSSKDDLEHLYSNLESFLNSPQIKSQADFLDKVSELDLRTQDKVFYSFQE